MDNPENLQADGPGHGSAAPENQHDDAAPSTEQEAGERPQRQPAGLLFRLIVPATSIFIVTILSLIAVLFGEKKAPMAQWLDRHGNQLLIVELISILLLAIVAMTVDRIQTLRKLAADASAASSSPESSPPDTFESNAD